MEDSLAANASIRVLVVPFGSISVGKFRHYFSSLCRLNTLKLQLVTPWPGYSKSGAALEFQDWQEQVVRFNFVVQGPEEEHEQDQTLSRLGWHSLQAHKRVVAVVGICDCVLTSDLDEALRNFDALVSKYPSTTVSRWCAFNATEVGLESHERLEAFLASGMDIIPPEKVMEDGSSSFDFNMERVLCNLSTTLLQQFDTIIREGRETVARLEGKTQAQAVVARPRSRADSFIEMLLNGVTYAGDDASTSKQSEAKARKRKSGRLQVWIGCFALLAGSPQDALNFFGDGIKNCSAANDYAWQGVALEASASASFLLRQQEGVTGNINLTTTSNSGNTGTAPPAALPSAALAPGDTTKANTEQHVLGSGPSESGSYFVVDDDIMAALEKAASLYAKVPGFWSLEAQVMLKLASYLAVRRDKCEQALGILGTLFRKACQELATAQTRPQRPHTVPRHLSAQQSEDFRYRYIEKQQQEASKLFRNVCIRSSVLFERFQRFRKSSFFLQQAAANEGNAGDSFLLLQLAAARLGIRLEYIVDQEKLPVEEQEHPVSYRTWLTTKKLMLHILIDAAQNATRSQMAIDYALQLLKVSDSKDAEGQKTLRKIIKANVNMGGFTDLSRACPFPVVHELRLVDPNKSLALHKRKRRRAPGDQENAKETSPLFYSPFEEAASATRQQDDTIWAPTHTWVQNEISSARVVLTNPTCFPVLIDSIALDVSFFEERGDDGSPSLSGGECIECHKASLTLQPNEKGHRVVLSCRPLISGRFVVRGCVISALGLKSAHKSSAVLQVDVVKAMPLLSFEHLTHRQSSLLEQGDREAGGSGLFDGEFVPIHCEMHRTSGINISECRVQASVSFEPPNAPSYKAHRLPEAYDAHNLGEIVAACDDNRDDASVSSGASGDSVADYLITSSSEFESQRVKVEGVVNGLTRANEHLEQALREMGQDVFVPQQFRIVLKARRGCRNVKILVAYAAESLPFERQFEMNFNLNVLPCLQILQIDALPTPSADHLDSFLVVLDVRNVCNKGFSVEPRRLQGPSEAERGDKKQRVSVEPLSIRRIAIPVTKDINEQVDDVHTWLDNAIALDWTCVSEPGRHGRVSLEGAKLAPAALQRLNSTGLVLLDALVRPREPSTSDGAFHVEISVRNRSDAVAFEDLLLSLHIKPGPISSHISWNGSLSSEIARLGPGETRSHLLDYQVLLPPEADKEEKHSLHVIVALNECSGRQREWAKQCSLSC